MAKRKFKSNISILLAEGDLIVKSCEDARYQHKVEMVNLVLNGMTPTELSQFCGESKNTIISWVKIVDEKGFQALHDKKRPGREKKLSSEQIIQVYEILSKVAPNELGYKAWTGTSLSDYIRKTYNIRLCSRQCQRIIKFHRES